MTRDYAAIKLLALGPLTSREFVEITGWPAMLARRVLHGLCERGEVLRLGSRGKYAYFRVMTE